MPLIAMEYAFGGGAAQDPAGKPGVGNMVAGLLDEGSGDLDSKTFHERLERRAIELSFSSTRDTFRGSLRMLKDNKDEAFDLLQHGADLAAFRRRPTSSAFARRCSRAAPRHHQPDLAGQPQIPRSWPSAIIPMAGRPTARSTACRRSTSPT